MVLFTHSPAELISVTLRRVLTRVLTQNLTSVPTLFYFDDWEIKLELLIQRAVAITAALTDNKNFATDFMEL